MLLYTVLVNKLPDKLITMKGYFRFDHVKLNGTLNLCLCDTIELRLSHMVSHMVIIP